MKLCSSSRNDNLCAVRLLKNPFSCAFCTGNIHELEWLFELDASESAREKWVLHQTFVKNACFGVSGTYVRIQMLTTNPSSVPWKLFTEFLLKWHLKDLNGNVWLFILQKKTPSNLITSPNWNCSMSHSTCFAWCIFVPRFHPPNVAEARRVVVLM